ncbi:MAG: UbiA family prenyltransferase [Chlorobium sp.]|uniref:UbiA family prenyltransferase n=1 Tax=Chlorobium sp. TaxID=1095 RepID=UPI0025BB5A88|nr:UbiA family prenyltransferase [Chlorobium sp.]MCF8217266.1 UbiA family prenyltransferase [Chlorobium sp.]MCF8272119.1 UbiA family prenyltransferase [Chlorobium sp.]MCF8288481.1 UbiA family prenyltransferase [Chlorobium sp.]MCF8292076.1 UbiA family prenyltransferase [Chlorobium sp.]MCF8386177.1 UbiA family prenyltransferase [Chlorobium sp.]
MPYYFFRNKLHLALLSALGAASWSVYFEIPVNGWTVLSVFLLTFSIYQDNRLTDDNEDSTNDPEGLKNALSHERLITYVTFYLLSALSLLIALPFGQPALWTTALVILIGFLYNHKCFPAFIARNLHGARRLKDIYIVKNLTPPIDWATALVFLPLFFEGKALSTKAWISWSYVFVCAFFVEVMWDMRDHRGDRLSGIRTIANTLSFAQTKRLLILASLISGLLLLYFTIAENLPPSTYFLLANNVAVIIIASLYNENKVEFMRRISDMTILLAALLFLSFGLIAFYCN